MERYEEIATLNMIILYAYDLAKAAILQKPKQTSGWPLRQKTVLERLKPQLIASLKSLRLERWPRGGHKRQWLCNGVFL
jgi:hypothetical protein